MLSALPACRQATTATRRQRRAANPLEQTDLRSGSWRQLNPTMMPAKIDPKAKQRAAELVGLGLSYREAGLRPLRLALGANGAKAHTAQSCGRDHLVGGAPSGPETRRALRLHSDRARRCPRDRPGPRGGFAQLRRGRGTLVPRRRVARHAGPSLAPGENSCRGLTAAASRIASLQPRIGPGSESPSSPAGCSTGPRSGQSLSLFRRGVPGLVASRSNSSWVRVASSPLARCSSDSLARSLSRARRRRRSLTQSVPRIRTQ